MAELTLESLAARVEELERKLADNHPPRNQNFTPATRHWRSVVGMFEDTEFTRTWIAETEAIREADRQAARENAVS
jgi:hypothetical protein